MSKGCRCDEVTLVEQAAAPRGGDYDVAERMGLLDELRRQDLDIRGFRIVDGNGRRISGIDQRAMQDLTGGRILSLPRSAVALALYHAVKDRIAVRFREGGSGRFDLVFGADGLHSALRRMAFGDDARFARFLGYYVAAFSAPQYPHRDPHTYVAYSTPGTTDRPNPRG